MDERPTTAALRLTHDHARVYRTLGLLVPAALRGRPAPARCRWPGTLSAAQRGLPSTGVEISDVSESGTRIFKINAGNGTIPAQSGVLDSLESTHDPSHAYPGVLWPGAPDPLAV